mmetsp:Transcript_40415/g.94323  ORF Transcript_40415/g.94323 Transcript_40415/m.94323 type:complete len:583 (-) Transcript_40415:14-1762(-)
MLPCEGRGNYNPHLSCCICPIGWGGPDCSRLVLPACRATAASTALACTVSRPQHCECHRQCEAHGAFVAHVYRFCFVRNESGDALSEIPSEGEPALFFETTAANGHLSPPRPVPRSRALMHEFNTNLRHLPLSRCARRCSDRGACVAHGSRQPSCWCDSYYSGRACETHASPTCFNDCAGRGVCEDGFCRCTPPFFGPGCAHGGDLARRAAGGKGGKAWRSRAKAFAVYVYDLPPIVLRRRTYGSDPDAIFSSCFVFFAALLRDESQLTAVPQRASLFAAPACGTNMEKLDEFYLHGRQHIASAAPWWARHNGGDHLWFTTADGGGCDFDRTPQLRTSIVLSHYLKLNRSAHQKPMCGRRGVDVSVPPRVPAVEDPAFLAAGRSPPARRPIDFYFVGNVPDAAEVASRSDESLAQEGYSEGVRQLVWKHLRHREGYLIRRRSATYARDWSQSKWCLAPTGVGWGVRLVWAVAAGCIPILASSEVSAWFDDVLPYDSFALRALPKEALPALPALLGRFNASAMAAMHAALLRVRRLFLWPPAGLAYELVMQRLCERARARDVGLGCTDVGALLARAALDDDLD